MMNEKTNPEKQNNILQNNTLGAYIQHLHDYEVNWKVGGAYDEDVIIRGDMCIHIFTDNHAEIRKRRDGENSLIIDDRDSDENINCRMPDDYCYLVEGVDGEYIEVKKDMYLYIDEDGKQEIRKKPESLYSLIIDKRVPNIFY